MATRSAEEVQGLVQQIQEAGFAVRLSLPGRAAPTGPPVKEGVPTTLWVHPRTDEERWYLNPEMLWGLYGLEVSYAEDGRITGGRRFGRHLTASQTVNEIRKLNFIKLWWTEEKGWQSAGMGAVQQARFLAQIVTPAPEPPPSEGGAAPGQPVTVWQYMRVMNALKARVSAAVAREQDALEKFTAIQQENQRKKKRQRKNT